MYFSCDESLISDNTRQVSRVTVKKQSKEGKQGISRFIRTFGILYNEITYTNRNLNRKVIDCFNYI